MRLYVPMLDTLHDIPRRVPSRERSGVMFANAADGNVTSAAEKKPNRCQQKSIQGHFMTQLTPQNAECDEVCFFVDTDPAQRQNGAGEGT